MNFYKMRNRLDTALHIEEVDRHELEQSMNELENQVFEDPFNSGALANLARAKIAFGNNFAFGNEQTSDYIADGIVYSERALICLPKDIILEKEVKYPNFFFFDNRRERLLDNDIRCQLYSNKLKASIQRYEYFEGLEDIQMKYLGWIQEVVRNLDFVLPTATNARVLTETYGLAKDFFSSLFKETENKEYAFDSISARVSQSESLNVAREIDPRFPKIKLEIIN